MGTDVSPKRPKLSGYDIGRAVSIRLHRPLLAFALGVGRGRADNPGWSPFPAMEITIPVSALIGQKGSDVWSIAPDTIVFDAIQMMSEKNVGALPVTRGHEVVGMFSERDYTRKIVLKGRSSKETSVGDVMSAPPMTVTPGDSIDRCMRLMTQNRVRHLPVVDNGRLVGIVSIGDLVNWIISAQGAAIEQLEQYIHGGHAS